MHIFVKSVTLMAARRTRRGRRRNRTKSSRRKLFVPVVCPSVNGRKWKQSLRSSFSQENVKTNSTKLPVTIALKNSMFLFHSSLDQENSLCEFTYSHWWNKTPQKKSHKLVRPPYTPTAPNNSTQYIINDRVPFENIYEMPDEESESLCNLNGSLVSGLGRNDLYERLSDCESISCKSTPVSETMESASVGTLSPTLIPETFSSTSKDFEDDSDYESPDDIDFFSFVQNDFLENYENMKRESLLRLSKEELISKMIDLEKTFDSLAKVVYPEITSLL